MKIYVNSVISRGRHEKPGKSIRAAQMDGRVFIHWEKVVPSAKKATARLRGYMCIDRISRS